MVYKGLHNQTYEFVRCCVRSELKSGNAKMRPMISEEYLKAQIELHKNPAYGVASLSYAPIVKDLFTQIGGRSISDYGAGKCNLKKALLSLGLTSFAYFPYDPVFPEYGPPMPADLVCCIDVLEHIEHEFIDNVIRQLSEITVNFGFFTIATGPAVKSLPDGRNAHLIQKPSSWWLPKLVPYFEVQHLQTEGSHGFWTVLTPIRK